MINDNENALKLIVSAIEKSGFKNGKDISICLDVAANELFKNKKYSIHSKKFITTDKTIDKYIKINQKNIILNLSKILLLKMIGCLGINLCEKLTKKLK